MGFLSTFLSYLVVMLVFIAVAGAAVALGICVRRKLDASPRSGKKNKKE